MTQKKGIKKDATAINPLDSEIISSKSFRGKVVIITGAGQGIGKAIALKLATLGTRVIIAEIDAQAGQEAEYDLKRVGEGLFVRTDVSQEKDVARLTQTTLKHFHRIDFLINNAACGITKPLIELKLSEWQHLLNSNLTGAFLCTKYSARTLIQKKGAIVNIASTRALMSEKNTEAYSASKGGLLALTHALAASLSPAVRVNAISPGWIETGDWKKRSHRNTPQHSILDKNQHWVGRVGTPADVVSLAVFLLSPESSFISGANFIVDGGMTRKMIYA